MELWEEALTAQVEAITSVSLKVDEATALTPQVLYKQYAQVITAAADTKPVSTKPTPAVAYCEYHARNLDRCATCEWCGRCKVMCTCWVCEECDRNNAQCECERCGFCSRSKSACNCSHRTEWATENWGFASTETDLARLAADFYLNYWGHVHGHEASTQLLEAWYDAHLATLVNYTDMVLGGELRHMASHLTTPKLRTRSPLHADLSHSTTSPCLMRVGPRAGMWWRWKRFRNLHGTQALVWAERVFNLSRGNVYGGKLWANIAHTLRLYEEGKISRLMFVDLVWGLEHNGGCYFNKVLWRRANPELMSVLQCNVKSDYAQIEQYASSFVVTNFKQAQEAVATQNV